jgi:hypothetical protein
LAINGLQNVYDFIGCEQMSIAEIQLTAEERALVERIDFNPSSGIHDADYWRSVGVAAQQLMEALLKRKAIPEVRTKFFTDPRYNTGGRGKSRLQVFEKNGTCGDAIFRHAHFLKYLHYFLYGPDHPADTVQAFEEKIADLGMITSSDIVPLGAFARQLTRSRALDPGKTAEEFFKLALENDLGLSAAQSIRDAVKRSR